MDNIDLTLRGEFRKDSKQQFEDTRRYKSKLGYQDQRRAKYSILDIDTMIIFFGFKIETKQYEEFFTEDKQVYNKDIKEAEDVCRITGVLTEYLKLEYDSGYGSENVCDCCGGFRSVVLNSRKFGLCNKCERIDHLNNKYFWDRTKIYQDSWVD